MPVESGEEIKENLIRQLTMPVLFEQTINRMIDDGITKFIEIGPGKTLSGFVKKCANVQKVKVSVYRTSDMTLLSECLKEMKKC